MQLIIIRETSSVRIMIEIVYDFSLILEEYNNSF